MNQILEKQEDMFLNHNHEIIDNGHTHTDRGHNHIFKHLVGKLF